jgi:hypothetical protein
MLPAFLPSVQEMRMKHRFTPSLVLAAEVFAMFMMLAGPARAQPTYPDLPFFNQGSLLCLQPVPEAALNGVSIQQQTCGSLYQNWTLRAWSKAGPSDPTQYLIYNSQTRLCLDDTNGNAANGTPVQQWSCNFDRAASTTSLWTVVPAPHRWLGYYVIKNVRTGKCLDVRAGSDQPGAVIQIYRCTNSMTVTNYAQLFGFSGAIIPL